MLLLRNEYFLFHFTQQSFYLTAGKTFAILLCAVGKREARWEAGLE